MTDETTDESKEQAKQMYDLLKPPILDIRGAFEFVERYRRMSFEDNVQYFSDTQSHVIFLLFAIQNTLDRIEAGRTDFHSAIRGWFDTPDCSEFSRWHDEVPLFVVNPQIRRLRAWTVTQICLMLLNMELSGAIKTFVAEVRARYDEKLFDEAMRLEMPGGFGRVTGFRLDAESKRVVVSVRLLNGRDAELQASRFPQGQGIDAFEIGDYLNAGVDESTISDPIQLSMDCCQCCCGQTNVLIVKTTDRINNYGLSTTSPICERCSS